jgi:hypothetical protein
VTIRQEAVFHFFPLNAIPEHDRVAVSSFTISQVEGDQDLTDIFCINMFAIFNGKFYSRDNCCAGYLLIRPDLSDKRDYHAVLPS